MGGGRVRFHERESSDLTERDLLKYELETERDSS